MRTSLVRQLYFTIVTLVTLTMMVSSLGYLVYTAFDSLVFVRSASERYVGTPPAFFPAKTDPETADLSCDDTCPFDAEEKAMFETWKTDYQNWKDLAARNYDAGALVNALSFLIVSAPLFFIHYRILKREYLRAQEGDHDSAVYAIYYYVAALGALIFAVVFTALLINSALRTWVITDASNTKSYDISRPVAGVTETQYLDAVVSCQDQCGFSDDDVALVNEWKSDYDENVGLSIDTWKDDFSRGLAVVLVTLPVFWYHWTLIRKKSKEETSEN